MKKILITGKNSFIGTSFENYMKNFDDYQIDTVDMIGNEWREYDFWGYDTVFHVAGLAHSDVGNVSDEVKAKYYEVNTNLTVETARKAKMSGVKQFIFMSSAIVYGDSAPIGKNKMITKDTPATPANFYGDSKLMAEKGISELGDENFKVVILRPPMIYGKGSKGNYPIISRLAKALPFFPYVNNQRSMLYIDNLTEFIRLVIKNSESGIFWPQNEQYTNTSQLVKMIAAVHGKRVILIKGFSWALKIMAHVTGIVNKAFGSLCYDAEMSAYKEKYCKFTLQESIEWTEK